jgi:hypothetical protein
MLTNDSPSMLVLKGLDEAERFVARQERLGSDIRWDNYDIVIFKPSHTSIYTQDGAFRNGMWGYENRSPIQSDGTWRVDHRNVKRARSTRD